MKAFPTLADNGHITTQDGMDLRDYFAAKVMVFYLSQKSIHDIPMWKKHDVATFSYEMADAMMEARKDD